MIRDYLTLDIINVLARFSMKLYERCRFYRLEIPFSKRIDGAQMVPRGYGVAWFSDYRAFIVCYPVPFNYVFAFIRRAYLGLKYPKWFRKVSDFEHGKEVGRRELKRDMDKLARGI